LPEQEYGDSEGGRDAPIAWIKMEHLGDVDEVKQDLRELSDRAGFQITRFEIDKHSDSNNRSKVVKVYSDGCEKIPKDKLSIVREWIRREVYWAQDVCNAKVRIEGGIGWKNMTKKTSKEEEKDRSTEISNIGKKNVKNNGKEEKVLPTEILRFYTSKEYFKELLEPELRNEIDSLKIDKDRVEITTTRSVLKTSIEDIYSRKVRSISIDEGKCEISISNQKIEKEGRFEETENTAEGGSGKGGPVRSDKSELFNDKIDEEKDHENDGELDKLDLLLDAIRNKKQ